MKFTEPGGRVSLSVKKDGDKAVVCISDTGCGMDAETGKNIFKMSIKGCSVNICLLANIADSYFINWFLKCQYAIGMNYFVFSFLKASVIICIHYFYTFAFLTVERLKNSNIIHIVIIN